MSADGTTDPASVGPALALLELSDVPTGFVALDALAKQAPVTVVSAGTVQCGRFLLLFGGDVDPVERAYARALERSGDAVLDAVLLPYAEARLLPALHHGDRRRPGQGDALGVVQTGSSPTLLRAIDAALKGALVDLVELRVAEGLGGRGLATLWGDQHDVEAALELASRTFSRGRPEGCTTALVANADPEVGRVLSRGTRFFTEVRG